MAYSKHLYVLLLSLLLNIVKGQHMNVAETLQEFLLTCPESCPLSKGHSNSTEARSDWCSHVEFSEPPYQVELPKCKNITVKSRDYDIKNSKLILQPGIDKKYRVPHKEYLLANDNKTANICYSLSPQLHQCNLKLLDRRHYAYDDSLMTLINCKTKDLVALGDFYVFPDSKKTVSCKQKMNFTFGTRPRCEYVNLGPKEYEFLDKNNTTIRLSWNHRTILQALYELEENSSNIELCFPLSIEMTTCERYTIYPHEYRKVSNHRILVLSTRTHLNLGDYKSYSKEKFVQYCRSKHKHKIDLVYYYCQIIQIISAVLILLAVVIHLVFPSINYHAKPLICQMLSLAVWFVAGPCRFLWYPQNEVNCYVLFTFIYFSAMTSFFWLNVMAFDLWSIFASLKTSSMLLCANMCNKKPKFVFYCVYAYGIPMVMTILSLVLQTNPSMQNVLDLHPEISTSCWFVEAKSLYLFYSGPIFFLLGVNMIFFGLTVSNLRRASEGVGMVNKNHNKQLLFVCIKIFVIMGLCWTIEFITFLADWRGAASYPAIITMSIQGILLFVIYICKPSTFRIVRRKVMGTISSKSKMTTELSKLPKSTSYSNNSSSGISMESVISIANTIEKDSKVLSQDMPQTTSL